ncbi:fungal-specific transcription factor domain-containing protein [Peziza echinospora]|nr:fungal-specific transcription factor domain-containing protein [Peziza echinospora]
MSIDSTGQANSPHTPHAPTAGQNGATVATQTSALPNESSSSTSPRNTTSTLDQSNASNNGTANSTKEPNNTTTTSDNNNPPSITNTRSRRDRPCDACRRRKSRCVLNEGTTVCVLCRFHNQDCTFLQSPQPRKRRLAAGATGDSKRDRDRERERDKEGRHRAPRMQRRPSSPSTPPHAPSHAYAPTAEASGHRSLNPVEDSTEEAPALKSVLGLQKSRHSQYLGSTSEYETALIDLCPLDPSDEFALTHPHHPDGSSFRRVRHDIAFLMLPDKAGQEAEDYDQELQDVNAVEALVSPNGQALIDLYFKVVHPSFPILHKKLFLEKYQRSHTEFAPCLLAAVYIIALTWWKHDPELSKSAPPDIAKLEALASRCMADVISRPKLSTIQAGLLMLQRLGPAASSKSWALTAQLVAVGQELGLHLDCVEWRIPAWEKGLRKRLAWALFMQDKWGALTHGRPSHITSSNWAVRQVALEDFPETSRDGEGEEEFHEIEKGKMLFMEMIKLTQITGEILDGFFTVDASRTLDGKINRVLERAKPMQIKLKEWYARLPEALRMDSATKPRKLSSNGYLHLAYFATEITLHRQILRTLSPPPTSPQPIIIPDQYLLHICRSAAKTRLISAMDFVNRLKPEHLQSFWYFASKVNFALIGTFGSLLWATSPTVQEAEFYKARLAEYRWTLSVSAKGADFMEFAVGVLDVGIGRVQQNEWTDRHAPKGGDSGMGNGVMASMSTGSGITSPAAQPPPPPPPLSRMSPPVTGDEMEQDEDDDDDDDDDGHPYDISRPGHVGFRIGHGSDHDVDMEFMGDSRYGYAGHDGDDDDDSDEYIPNPSHPLGTYVAQSPQYQTHHQPQQNYRHYGPRGIQSYQYSTTHEPMNGGILSAAPITTGGRIGVSKQ